MAGFPAYSIPNLSGTLRQPRKYLPWLLHQAFCHATTTFPHSTLSGLFSIFERYSSEHCFSIPPNKTIFNYNTGEVMTDTANFHIFTTQMRTVQYVFNKVTLYFLERFRINTYFIDLKALFQVLHGNM